MTSHNVKRNRRADIRKYYKRKRIGLGGMRRKSGSLDDRVRAEETTTERKVETEKKNIKIKFHLIDAYTLRQNVKQNIYSLIRSREEKKNREMSNS